MGTGAVEVTGLARVAIAYTASAVLGTVVAVNRARPAVQITLALRSLRSQVAP